MLYFKKNTQGFTLIEALIALTVTSLGALALASFQTDLTKTGGLNKTRSEALVLAEAKLATFKNKTSQADYDTDLNEGGPYDDPDNPLTGTNASFTRQWTITDKTNPERKQVEVTVSWPVGASTEKVTLMTVLSWTNPGNSNLDGIVGANQATPLKSPSPNNNSSTLDSGLAIDTSATLTSLASGLFKTKDVDGNTILIDTATVTNNTNTLLTCYGNIELAITGTIHTVNTLNAIRPAVSQFGTCAFNPTSNQTSADYGCYVCGNCEDSAGDYGCPAVPAPGNDIGPGGWRGKVGLTGLVDGEKVCQSAHINDTDSEPSTAREYTTLRTYDNGTIKSEGINTPYACQNFLIVNQNGNNSNSNCATEYDKIKTNDPNFIIANKKITRTLTGIEENTVLATNTDACSSAQYNYTVSGTISGSHTNKVELAFNRNGQFFENPDTPFDYQFEVTSNESDVTLTATIVHPGTQISAHVDSCTTPPTITDNDTAEVKVIINDPTDHGCINFT
ncbi:MAG: prepilin-type N-terminal cleavage/methylation domain-containing protein, partial [Methylococcales bacterium]